MTDVVALVVARHARARLASASHGARMVFCERCGEVLRHADRIVACARRLGAVVLEPWDVDGVSSASIVAHVRSRHPTVPVLGYCAPQVGAAEGILALARADVNALILRGHDDEGVALRAAFAAAHDDYAARTIVRAVAPGLPRAVRTVIEHCARHGRTPLSVSSVARALGVSRKTLASRLAAAGLPQPHEVIAWTRLCLLLHALEAESTTIERAALEFGFPSGTAVRNLCKRYTGRRVSEIRQHGGFAWMVDAFVAALHGHASRAGTA